MTKNARGFTLIEIAIVVAVTALLGGAVAALQRNALSLNAILQDGLTGQQEMRKTVRDFVSEVRSAVPSGSGAYPLATVATSTLTFYSDLDLDNAPERIRYFMSGTTLRKGITEPSGNPVVYNTATERVSDVVHNVTVSASSIFEYYDASYGGEGAPLAQPVNVLNVRLIKITLTVDRDARRAPAPVTITAQASMRNLKDNL
jgi:prepilin-type N-terminal cleavage/methylation domain-containing protein